MRPLDADLWEWVDRQPTHPSVMPPARHRRPLIPGPYGRYLVEGICGWEFAALVTGLVPTITAILQPRQRHVAVRAVVVVALCALAHHLLVESPGIPQPKEQ